MGRKRLEEETDSLRELDVENRIAVFSEKVGKIVQECDCNETEREQLFELGEMMIELNKLKDFEAQRELQQTIKDRGNKLRTDPLSDSRLKTALLKLMLADVLLG